MTTATCQSQKRQIKWTTMLNSFTNIPFCHVWQIWIQFERNERVTSMLASLHRDQWPWKNCLFRVAIAAVDIKQLILILCLWCDLANYINFDPVVKTMEWPFLACDPASCFTLQPTFAVWRYSSTAEYLNIDGVLRIFEAHTKEMALLTIYISESLSS
jgi:hypothetical protein